MKCFVTSCFEQAITTRETHRTKYSYLGTQNLYHTLPRSRNSLPSMADSGSSWVRYPQHPVWNFNYPDRNLLKLVIDLRSKWQLESYPLQQISPGQSFTPFVRAREQTSVSKSFTEDLLRFHLLTLDIVYRRDLPGSYPPRAMYRSCS